MKISNFLSILITILLISMTVQGVNFLYYPPTEFELGTRYFKDKDGDGYGDPMQLVHSLFQPEGYVPIGGDCDDNNKNVTSSILFDFYKDNDQDGIGDFNTRISACSQPKGYVTSCCDCDDNDPKIGKGDLTTYYRDLDNDGYGDLNFPTFACKPPKNYVIKHHDCDDTDPKVNIGQVNYYSPDQDKDGYGFAQESRPFCKQPEGWVNNNLDCNDQDAKIGKGTLKLYFKDFDRDGIGNYQLTMFSCEKPIGFTEIPYDCDDNDKAIGQGNFQFFYADEDGDGYGNPNRSIYACKAPIGFVFAGNDCNDTEFKINPGVKDLCNGIDDNCNGNIDEGAGEVSIESARQGGLANGYLCYNDKPIVLIGKPEGGTFSIDGNPLKILDPADFIYDGVHKIEYAVQVNGCLIKVYKSFKKYKVTEPVIIGLKDTYRQDQPAIKTFPNDTVYPISGNHPIGVFTIDGNKITVFNPAVYDTGYHKISFTINEGGCISETSKIIRILPPVAFEPRTKFYQDLDNDSYGNPLMVIHSTIQPKGYVPIDGDCDDNDSKITTDFLFYFYEDKDQDGIGSSENGIRACSQPKGYVTACCDCDDNDASIGKGELKVYYRDLDGDGYGDFNFYKLACQPPKGYIFMSKNLEDFDCDDLDPKINKGNLLICFPDEDGDGYGNGKEQRLFCSPPKGWVLDRSDCDDHNPKVGEGDYNFFLKDYDQDGYGDQNFAISTCDSPSGYVFYSDYLRDCNDNDKTVGPGVFNTFWKDRDQDGLGDSYYYVNSCQMPNGFVANSNDCDDTNSKILGTQFYYFDRDLDGYGGSVYGYTCPLGKGFSLIPGDCNDSEPTINPRTKETCNGKDDNCNGSIDEGKTPVSISGIDNSYICSNATPILLEGIPSGGVFSIDGKQTKELDISKFKIDGAHTIEYALFTDGCLTKVYTQFKKIDGEQFYYFDNDLDGYGGMVYGYACFRGKGFTTVKGDCNDNDPSINPGKEDICNSVDDNCNGTIDEGSIKVSIEGIPSHICYDSKPIPLKGMPKGGVFTIDGKVVTELDPQKFKINVYTLVYTVYLDSCKAITSTQFKIVKLNDLFISGLKESYFQSDSAFELKGNYPGIFIIDNIAQSSYFIPEKYKIGYHTITYMVSLFGCTEKITKTIQILPAPSCPFWASSYSCYKIINRKSIKALTVRNGSMGDNALITQKNYTGLPNQKWLISPSENGTYTIYSLNSNKHFEPISYFMGSPVLQTDSTPTYPESAWKIECTFRPGYYSIISKKNNLFMDIAARSDANGAEVITWYWTNRENQYWQIIPVDCMSPEMTFTSDELESREQPDPETKMRVNIYPNPTQTYLWINKTSIEKMLITFYNPVGRKIYQTTMPVGNTPVKIYLPPDLFPKGLYYLTVGNQKNAAINKFIVN